MAKEYRAAVDSATGRILYGGWGDRADATSYDVVPGLSPGQVRVVLDRDPNLLTERVADVVAGTLRAATGPERAQVVSDRDDFLAARTVETKELQAVLLTALWFALGHQPTGPEIALAKTRFGVVFKALS